MGPSKQMCGPTPQSETSLNNGAARRDEIRPNQINKGSTTMLNNSDLEAKDASKACESQELSEAEIEAVAGARDYDLGFGIHLVVIGSYSTVYRSCYKSNGIEVCPA
jgi:hypothetical protein